MNITLVEDDPIQQRLIQHWLSEAGHHCRVFGDAISLMRDLQRAPTDVLLLDWELPDMDGLSLLHWLREQHGDSIPVLFLTMRGGENDVVAALRGGADDYLVKPARQQELLARIEANMRRSHGSPSAAHTTLEIGPFQVDRHSFSLSRDGEIIDLTQKEFNLACHLFERVGEVVSRHELVERVWGKSCKQDSRTVDTHISRLRKKLGLTPQQGWRLASIYQSGYRLDRLDPQVD